MSRYEDDRFDTGAGGPPPLNKAKEVVLCVPVSGSRTPVCRDASPTVPNRNGKCHLHTSSAEELREGAVLTKRVSPTLRVLRGCVEDHAGTAGDVGCCCYDSSSAPAAEEAEQAACICLIQTALPHSRIFSQS
ncbi:hypothetical protein ROHU_018542 [Labeo rohita]|uniref:Uncharacterized protein n=1 Tax=Labeo rohita TaxID=84645 RepID=A0A498NDL6_LABRO|nr:hypothetical protein ROHU_018542 [Labeo rohita]